LGNHDAVAPSAFAASLLALGRERPEALFECLDKISARERSKEKADGLTHGKADYLRCRAMPSMVKRVFVPQEHIFCLFQPSSVPRVWNLPGDLQIVGCRWDPERKGVVLILQSGTYPPIEEGREIPELYVGWRKD
jgi:hypothetical protein